METPAHSNAVAKRPASSRSRVTNGRRSFVDGEGRSTWSRRWRDLVELHISDLGGADTLSEGQLSMCRRIATLECEIEGMEGRLSKGETVDLDLYNRAAGNLRRLLETIGLKRVAKTVASPLAAHFEQPYRSAAE